MKIRPIRKDLLIHNVIYKKPIESNGWNDLGYAETQVMNVRIEESISYHHTPQGDKIQSGHLMFWDAYYSTASKFVVGGKIVHDGQEMSIISINKYNVRSRLHHLEIRLT